LNATIADIWRKFERWAYRYRRVGSQTIKDISSRGYCEPHEQLFLNTPYELNVDWILDLNLSELDLVSRLKEKISFLRGYLVDISYDGAAHMQRYSRFLSQQYPSRCNKSLGLFFEQAMTPDCEAGSYFGFQGFQANLFCGTFNEIDITSIRNILPFNRLYVRRPYGGAWNSRFVKTIIKEVKNGLEYEYTIDTHIDEVAPRQQMLTIEFKWHS
jgi:hypothetical protein